MCRIESTIIEFEKETRDVVMELLDSFGGLPSERHPLSIGLQAICSAGSRLELARLNNDRMNEATIQTSKNFDETNMQALKYFKETRDDNLASESHIQATLLNLGIINDRTAIEWINRIAPEIARDKENYDRMIEGQRSEAARFFSALKPTIQENPKC
jgi:hypothetical protein